MRIDSIKIGLLFVLALTLSCVGRTVYFNKMVVGEHLKKVPQDILGSYIKVHFDTTNVMATYINLKGDKGTSVSVLVKGVTYVDNSGNAQNHKSNIDSAYYFRNQICITKEEIIECMALSDSISSTHEIFPFYIDLENKIVVRNIYDTISGMVELIKKQEDYYLFYGTSDINLNVMRLAKTTRGFMLTDNTVECFDPDSILMEGFKDQYKDYLNNYNQLCALSSDKRTSIDIQNMDLDVVLNHAVFEGQYAIKIPKKRTELIRIKYLFYTVVFLAVTRLLWSRKKFFNNN